MAFLLKIRAGLTVSSVTTATARWYFAIHHIGIQQVVFQYGVEFGFDNYEKMSEIMRLMKGKIIVTVNDIAEMRECFSDFVIEQLEITYTLGKAKDGKRANKSCELLIRNF